MTGNLNGNKSGEIARQLIKFSLPLIFSGILQQLYNWADAFIVGNVNGEAALAAVGATATVVNFYVTVITGFTLGLTILFAQMFGRGEIAAIPKLLSTFAIFLGGIFILLAGIGAWATPALLRLLHTTPDTISLAEEYLRIVFIGIPFLAVYNVYSGALRGIGDSRAPFYSVLLSSAVNVALDIVFVAFLHWSVAGAAVATVVSQASMTAFLVSYSGKKYGVLRFCLNRHSFDKTMLAQGCCFGVPPMLQSGIGSAGSLLLQNFMNGFGTQTVAAVTTAYRVDSIVMVPLINLGSGISTLVAQCYGEGRVHRAKKIFAVGTALMAAVSLLLTVLVIPAGGRLIAMFGAGEEAIEIGGQFFRRIAGFYLIYGLATAIRGHLEGAGDMLYTSLAGIAALASRIIASYLLVPLFANMVIAYAEGLSWVLLLLLYAIRMLWRERRFKKGGSYAGCPDCAAKSGP